MIEKKDWISSDMASAMKNKAKLAVDCDARSFRMTSTIITFPKVPKTKNAGGMTCHSTVFSSLKNWDGPSLV